MPLVMLKKSWPGTFHRSVRDKSGKILRTLEFAAGEPIEVCEEDLPSIEKDLDVALVYVRRDDKQRIRVVDSVDEANDESKAGPDEGTELVPLDKLTDDELLKLAESEGVDVSACGDREQIIAALQAAGIKDVELGPTVDLTKLSIKQLQQYAAEHKVDVSNCKKKADFIAALEAASPVETDNA